MAWLETIAWLTGSIYVIIAAAVLAANILVVLDDVLSTRSEVQKAAVMVRGGFLVWPLILVRRLRAKLAEIDHEMEGQ